MTAPTTYKCLTGRTFRLVDLNNDERCFLENILEAYSHDPTWAQFSRQWIRLGRRTIWKRRVEVKSPVYRICQDLENRLGIAERRVSPPDYRDRLADLVEANFKSRYQFCKRFGIDQGQLSRVLSGRGHLGPGTLSAVLKDLGLEIAFVSQEEMLDEPFGR